jgi:hypothetical protein
VSHQPAGIAAARVVTSFSPAFTWEFRMTARRSVLFTLLAAVALAPGCSRSGPVAKPVSPTRTPPTAEPAPPAADADAAARAEAMARLKKIGLAMLSYHDANLNLPANQPGLSWRVAILPYLGEAKLFLAFKLNEPWDSPTNKPLIEQMPQVFASPKNPAPAGQTYLRAFVGESAAMPVVGKLVGKPPHQSVHGRRIPNDFTDGTVNTLCVAEAGEPVIWTKPDGLQLPEAGQSAKMPKLGGPFPGGFYGLMLDDTVHWFPDTLSASDLRALVTINGNDMPSPEVRAILHAPLPQTPRAPGAGVRTVPTRRLVFPTRRLVRPTYRRGTWPTWRTRATDRSREVRR